MVDPRVRERLGARFGPIVAEARLVFARVARQKRTESLPRVEAAGGARGSAAQWASTRSSAPLCLRDVG